MYQQNVIFSHQSKTIVSLKNKLLENICVLDLKKDNKCTFENSSFNGSTKFVAP